jgi:histidinol phosphatase-like PHP family hydrolase
MPEESLVNTLIENGIKTVTIGSDSHSPDQIGSFFSKALQILNKNGIERPCTFQKRNPICR